MADGRHVGIFSKCHNSPTDGPTETQLGYGHFSEIQDSGRRHLGFSDYVNLAIPAC